jgi:hypothetical protein
MQITARAYSTWTGNTWSVVDSPLQKTQLAATPEGSITITFSTAEVALSGRFNMEMSLGREEIEAIFRMSVVGATDVRVANLEKEIKDLKKTLSSAQ